jgi:diaminohydroxyphosphoribosylaminopyrimidine deaminase / 5-amino-6-(5-phosphoribosylamino)uracil reductase
VAPTVSPQDWHRDTPAWPALLAAANGGPIAAVEGSPLWPVYAPLIIAARERRSLVVGQAGQSLDGRVATAQGHSHYVNGPAGILHLHRLRALVDAVVVGAGTVIADDPQLTVREVEGPHPARVVIDPDGQATNGAQCMADTGVRRIVLCQSAGKPNNGVEFIPVVPFEPAQMLRVLRDCGFQRILIEGGPTTLSSFLAHDCLDRLHLLVAPMIIGSGKASIQLAEIDTLHEAMRPSVAHYALPGGDVLFDCALR